VRYTLQDLSPADATASNASAINEAGVVAGYTEINRFTRAARARDGGPLQVPPGLESLGSAATAVNANGDLAGYVRTSSDPDTVHAMRYTDAGGLVDLGSLGGDSYGFGINRWGQVAGYSYAGSVFNIRAFLATPGQAMRDLGTLTGFGSSFASGINDAGQVAGHSEAGGGRWHAFRFTPGLGLQDLGTPADAYSYAGGINASGQVVGRIDRIGIGTHAFRYTDGVGLQDIHALGTGSWAMGLNDAGAVVGFAFTGDPRPHAFLYTDADGMVDLNTLIDAGSGWVLNMAAGINNAGEIVGQGTYQGDLNMRAFKLTPRRDVTAPVIAAATADPASLWPANLRMVAVTITVAVTDDQDPAPQCRITGVTSREPASEGAIQITGGLTLNLRAERAGLSAGRTYQVAVACSDASGNTASRDVTVGVPHDQSGGH
jgi:probable HAF family extracellular repeat protein